MPTYGPATFIWTNMDYLQANLRLASPRATALMGATIEDVLYDVFEQSQIEVPVDTGALRASGHNDPVNAGPGIITGTIGYGARYAFYVHENLHARHPHGGKAKFLEDPFKNALNDLTSKTRARLEGAIVGQGVGAGSKSHAAESQESSRHGTSRRSLSHRSGAGHDEIHEMLQRAEAYRHAKPEDRPMIVKKGGRMGLKF